MSDSEGPDNQQILHTIPNAVSDGDQQHMFSKSLFKYKKIWFYDNNLKISIRLSPPNANAEEISLETCQAAK